MFGVPANYRHFHSDYIVMLIIETHFKSSRWPQISDKMNAVRCYYYSPSLFSLKSVAELPLRSMRAALGPKGGVPSLALLHTKSK